MVQACAQKAGQLFYDELKDYKFKELGGGYQKRPLMQQLRQLSQNVELLLETRVKQHPQWMRKKHSKMLLNRYVNDIMGGDTDDHLIEI